MGNQTYQVRRQLKKTQKALERAKNDMSALALRIKTTDESQRERRLGSRYWDKLHEEKEEQITLESEVKALERKIVRLKELERVGLKKNYETEFRRVKKNYLE